MARVKGAMMTRKRRNKVLGLAKGYWGNKSRHFKMAKEQVMKSGRYAYVGRKQKKQQYTANHSCTPADDGRHGFFHSQYLKFPYCCSCIYCIEFSDRKQDII